MEYEIEEKNPNCLNKYPWYNTAIYSQLHETVFEDFIINARIDIYDIMCYIAPHDRQQPTYVDDVISYAIGKYLIIQQQQN